MKADWTAQISQLEQIYDQLKQTNLTVPSFIYNSLPISKQDIEESIQYCLQILKLQNGNQVEPLAYLIHHPGLTSSIVNLQPHLVSFISSGSSQQYVDNFLGQLWGVVANVNAINNDKTKLENLENYINKSSSLKNKLEKLISYEKALQSAKSITDDKTKELEDVKTTAEILLKSIEQNSQEITNFKALTESNAVQTTSTKEKIDNLLVEVINQETVVKSLIKSLDDIKVDAEKTLGLSSQVALAGSFKIRKKSLEKVQVVWTFLFITGLVILFVFTLTSLSDTNSMHLPSIISQNGNIEIWGTIVRVLLSGPIIWLTWFSVKQFNNNVALIEDYAFKEASALAFVGYKKDMQSDEQMIKLLSESAIKNFSYAPSRLISSNDPASPMHDLFESALKDKGLFDRLVELLRVLKPTKD